MASNLVGGIVNGQYVKTDASKEATKSDNNINSSKSEGKDGTQYNQDMFLQLLVAEMQYQDPLEPSDNSQYIAQLASFTQIEAIQSVQANMDNIEANSLVGKYVEINDNGNLISGKVDYVINDDKKGLLVSVGGEQYEKKNVQTVVDEKYYNAVYMSSLLTDAINKLPSKEQVTVLDEKKITEAVNYYNEMTEYERGFVDKDLLTKFNEVVEQYKKIVEAKSAAEKERAEAEEASTTTTTETVEGA